MGCIPVGMEQFPASNMSQMEYIKMMLDDCDYYLLILAGRYGETDSDGVGFTEKEYDYAIERGIPVMSFIIKDIGSIPSDKCETKDEGRERLRSFRDKVRTGKLVKTYSDTGTLQAAVAISLNRCIQDFPAVGWVRGDNIETSDDIETKIEKYLKEHTVSTADIDALFDGEPLVFDCGNASLTHGDNTAQQTESPSRDTLEISGALKIVDEVAKRMPKISLTKSGQQN